MNIGMLWFDNDPKTDITVKISRAVDYYRQKYGQTPNLCFVHPSMVKSGPAKTGNIEVRSSRSVLPNHFWLGQNAGST
jgi:mevalonate pyrophosphate decarboxylase